MAITIKENGSRFGVRVAAIIFNKDMSKIFMQRQAKHDFYMFPGGRLDVNESATTAILRELKEELDIEEVVKLKYIAESFIKFPDLKYHEIGFYFIVHIEEEKYNYYSNIEYDSKDEINDGKSKFKWIDIKNLNKYNITPEILKNKIINRELEGNNIEHFVYSEY